MNINYKFTKQQSAIILNLFPIFFYITIIIIALIDGRSNEFYNNFIEALFYFMFPPLSIITMAVSGVMLIILGNFIFGVYANSKQCVEGCSKKETKMNNVVRFFEIVNIFLLIFFLSYTSFIAKPKNERDMQDLRNESIINMRYETNSELTKFKCEILPKNDSTKNLTEAVRLSKAGKIEEATKQLEWAIEKLEIQRDFLKKMKTPDNKWKRSINDALTITIDNKDIDKIIIFKDDISNLNNSKYNFTKEAQQDYIIGLAAPDFEIQSFQEQIIDLFNRVHCN